MFQEARGWRHEDEFLCVAFQNRVAQAMGGNNMHAGGDISIDGHSSLKHTDVDVLYTRNQYLRWAIVDELPTVPNDLIGRFQNQLAQAGELECPCQQEHPLQSAIGLSLYCIGKYQYAKDIRRSQNTWV